MEHTCTLMHLSNNNSISSISLNCDLIHNIILCFTLKVKSVFHHFWVLSVQNAPSISQFMVRRHICTCAEDGPCTVYIITWYLHHIFGEGTQKVYNFVGVEMITCNKDICIILIPEAAKNYWKTYLASSLDIK